MAISTLFVSTVKGRKPSLGAGNKWSRHVGRRDGSSGRAVSEDVGVFVCGSALIESSSPIARPSSGNHILIILRFPLVSVTDHSVHTPLLSLFSTHKQHPHRVNPCTQMPISSARPDLRLQGRSYQVPTETDIADAHCALRVATDYHGVRPTWSF